jgi:hypothetical protein
MLLECMGRPPAPPDGFHRCPFVNNLGITHSSLLAGVGPVS